MMPIEYPLPYVNLHIISSILKILRKTGADALKVSQHSTCTYTYFVMVAFAQKEIMEEGGLTAKKERDEKAEDRRRRENRK